MKKRLYLSLFLITAGFGMQTYASGSSSSSTLPQFNTIAFEANAALYGNKTANLMKLEKIAAHLNQIQSDNCIVSFTD